MQTPDYGFMSRKLKIKVCGMKYNSNRQEIEKLPVDFLGFIFYPESKRFVGNNAGPGLFDADRPKVAVFVDENIFEILGLVKNLGFGYVQLHGKENPDTCRILKKQGIQVIKAFNLNEEFDFSLLKKFNKSVNYFLFDTKTDLPGGSGEKFNWGLLEKYTGNIPFFLSGGIKPGDAEQIRQLNHPMLYGIDLNSGFEDSPGVKNYEALEKFLQILHAGH
jgi:phosphoribosylanthranilate isomerase